MQAAQLASHRFGYSQPRLQTLANDPRSWVLAQLDSPAAFDAEGLIDSAKAWQITRDVLQAALNPTTPPNTNPFQDALGPMTPALSITRSISSVGGTQGIFSQILAVIKGMWWSMKALLQVTLCLTMVPAG